MGDSEVDKCHSRTHVRGELNLGKEKFGKRERREGEKRGREGREKWGERKERREGVGEDEEEGRQRKDEL